jgi:hypothetical protein
MCNALLSLVCFVGGDHMATTCLMGLTVDTTLQVPCMRTSPCVEERLHLDEHI